MVTIPVKAHLAADGVLDLRVPTGLSESDVEVLVIVRPVIAATKTWPENFFEETYGVLADHPIERSSQGSFEEREVLS